LGDSVSKKILRDKSGRFAKGESANPGGRKGTEFGNWLRNNPKSQKVWEKILNAAISDDDARQTIAWKLVADRTAPSLKATEMKVKDQGQVPVIVIPEHKPDGAPVTNEPLLTEDNIDAKA
tara:strand:+ start:1604 stop:1966 length:363 start_codon:yes stop_codon:yes gene_type:complete